MKIITLPYAYALVDTPLDVCRVIVECTPGLSPEQDDWSKERARRLLAMWTACEGISTDVLERVSNLDMSSALVLAAINAVLES